MITFTLKKILARFFFPLPFVIFLIFTGIILMILSQKYKLKYTKYYVITIFAISLAILITGGLFGELLFIACTKDRKPLNYFEIPKGKVIICVTCFGYTPNADGIPSETKLFGETKNRLNEGCRLASICMKSNKDWQLVVSIAGKEDYIEERIKTVLAYCATFNLPENKIKMISNVKNTKDEIREFSKYNGKLIIVSHPLHLPRIHMLARKNKINILTSASDVCGKYQFEPWKIMPSARNFYLSEMIVYELLGRMELLIFR